MQGLVDGHLQSAQHHGEKASGAGAAHHVEDFAWLGDEGEMIESLDLEHDLLENGKLANGRDAASICFC